MSTWQGVGAVDLALIQKRINESARKHQPLGAMEPQNKGVRPPATAETKRKVAMAVSAKKKLQRERLKQKPFVPEYMVLAACQDVLEAHPLVALWWRQNTGAAQVAGRYIKFSFKGASDLMGVLTSGIFIAVECKATGKKASPEQHAFLANVIEAGGKAFIVDDAKDLHNALNLLSIVPDNAPNSTQVGAGEARDGEVVFRLCQMIFRSALWRPNGAGLTRRR